MGKHATTRGLLPPKYEGGSLTKYESQMTTCPDQGVELRLVVSWAVHGQMTIKGIVNGRNNLRSVHPRILGQ